MKRSRVLLLTMALWTVAAQAQSSSDSVPLFFPADKNSVQVLPQRFEYNLVDEDNIKIGDITIDSASFGFQVAPSVQFPGKYRARFVWPAGLLKEGSLLIKDSTGKAVWTRNISRKNIRLQNSQSGTQVAELVVDQISPTLIEDMKYFPFMNFCISRTNLDTKIYLCSKEHYLDMQKNRPFIRARSLGKRAAFVEINGRSVSNQGIISLNDETENIGFRAMTQSGAVLEIETRMKPVDFKDVVLSEDKKEIILTASGAEPVDEAKVQRVSDDEWKLRLETERPVVYLQGEGNIPMRQEFFIKGEVPASQARPVAAGDSLNRIYKSTLNLELTAAPNTSLSPTVPHETLQRDGERNYQWHLQRIPVGENSRHYVKVTDKENSYIAGYDVYRDYPYEALAKVAYWLPVGQIYTALAGQWWIENFLGLQNSWTRLHWGLGVQQSLLLTKKDGEANLNITHAELSWRARPGFHFRDATWGLSLPFEVLQASGFSTTTFGLGVFYSSPASENFQNYFTWYDTKLNYFLGGSGKDVQLTSALQASVLAYLPVDKRWNWTYGASVNQYSFDPGESKLQFELSGGIHARF